MSTRTHTRNSTEHTYTHLMLNTEHTYTHLMLSTTGSNTSYRPIAKLPAGGNTTGR